MIGSFMPVLLISDCRSDFSCTSKDKGRIAEFAERGDMDFNDFTALPKSQAKSVKLNGR